LDHPNVVPLFAAGEADGQLYLSMRYVDGTDLKALLHERGRLEPREAATIAAQVGSALDAAHARGLVHRGRATSSSHGRARAASTPT
jgi:serine/threonine protein kinase